MAIYSFPFFLPIGLAAVIADIVFATDETVAEQGGNPVSPRLKMAFRAKQVGALSGSEFSNVMDLMDKVETSEMDSTEKQKRKKRVLDKRVLWTTAEEEEIQRIHNVRAAYPTAKYFQKIFKTLARLRSSKEVDHRLNTNWLEYGNSISKQWR